MENFRLQNFSSKIIFCRKFFRNLFAEFFEDLTQIPFCLFFQVPGGAPISSPPNTPTSHRTLPSPKNRRNCFWFSFRNGRFLPCREITSWWRLHFLNCTTTRKAMDPLFPLYLKLWVDLTLFTCKVMCIFTKYNFGNFVLESKIRRV